MKMLTAVMLVLLTISGIAAQAAAPKHVNVKCERDEWGLLNKNGMTAEVTGVITFGAMTTISDGSSVKRHQAQLAGRLQFKLFNEANGGNQPVFTVPLSRAEGILQIYDGIGNSPDLFIKVFDGNNQRVPVAITVGLNQLSLYPTNRFGRNLGWITDSDGDGYRMDCSKSEITY